jgi:hypothetical protein
MLKSIGIPRRDAMKHP